MLGPARDLLDPSSCQVADQPSPGNSAQDVIVGQAGASEPAAKELGPEVTNNGFDFRKLRHGGRIRPVRRGRYLAGNHGRGCRRQQNTVGLPRGSPPVYSVSPLLFDYSGSALEMSVLASDTGTAYGFTTSVPVIVGWIAQ
jgi:hypothetical protein